MNDTKATIHADRNATTTQPNHSLIIKFYE